jgi:hypothetical protein
VIGIIQKIKEKKEQKDMFNNPNLFIEVVLKDHLGNEVAVHF